MIDKNMKILVAGAGTMGNSIAQGFATAGFKATMYSRTLKTLEAAKAQIDASLKTCEEFNLLGGQKISEDVELESGVPVLSKIPVLGRLFDNRSKIKDQKVLLILVRPTIILQEEADSDAIAAIEGEMEL